MNSPHQSISLTGYLCLVGKFLTQLQKFRIILFLITFSFFSVSSKAQCPTIFIDDLNGVPGYPQIDDLSVCGVPDTITFYILNTSGQDLLNSELMIQMPLGIEYAGILDYTDPSYPVAEGDLTDLQNPSFILAKFGADSVQIVNIGVIATCSIYENGSTDTYEFDTEFNFLFDDGGKTPLFCTTSVDGKVDYGPYLKRPSLTITNIKTPNVKIINDADKCSDITITQAGIGASLTSFDFDIMGVDLNNFDISILTVNGIAMPYVVDPITGVVSFHADETYLPGGALTEDESVVVRICYSDKLGCDTDKGSFDLTYSASFGCGGDEPCVNPSTGNGTLQYAPNYGANPIVTTSTVQFPVICGDNAIFDVTVTSAQKDPVLGLWEEIIVGFQICEADAFDAANVLINGVPLDPSMYYYENFDFVVDFTTLTFDPDGPGVGLEDLDGDGLFDDMPGGNTLNLTIEAAIKCQDPQQIAGCAALDCSFSQAFVGGLRHCDTEFQTTDQIVPPAEFSYGAESITIDEIDINDNGSVFGYNFGLGSTGLNTVTMEFCYEFGSNGIGECQDGNSYFEVAVAGPRQITKDLEINTGSVTFDGAAVAAGDINTFYDAPDSSSVVFQVFAGSNDLGRDLCYNVTLELDSCICYPRNYAVANMRVIEECNDCQPDPCTIVRACDKTFLASQRNCECVCFISDEIVEMRRCNFGFADPEMTIPFDENSPEVQNDLTKFLPCDSIYVHMEFEVLDAFVLNSVNEFRLYFRRYASPRNNSPGIEVTTDINHMVTQEFSFSKNGSTTRIPIDLSGMDCVSGQAATVQNLNDGFFDNIGFKPIGINPNTGLSTYNSGQDILDNEFAFIYIVDRDDIAANGGNATLTGDCLSYLFDDLMGGLEDGDKFHWIAKVPLQKNPYRLLNADIAAEPIEAMFLRSRAETWTTLNGKKNYSKGSCGGNVPVETYCPEPIEVITEYNIGFCDSEVKHTFKVPAFPPPYDTWYENEYRPFWEFDTIQIPLISPLVYAGGDSIFINDGPGIPLSEPDFNTDATCVYDSGQNYCTSNSGAVGYMSYDVSEFPELSLGIGGAPGDSVCLVYNLERICPGVIESPQNFLLFYDYSYLCDYNPGGRYCNLTMGSATGTNAFFNTGLVYPVENCPGNVSTSAPLFWERDYHLFKDTSATLIFNPDPTVLPPLDSNVESILISDNEDAPEFNIYTVCAGDGDIPHSNVITTIVLPPTVELINVTDTLGGPIAYTETGSTSTETTYVIELAQLNQNECFAIMLETELLFCPLTPDGETEICVKTTSSCMPLELASQLFGSGGESCTSSKSCYEYVAGEAEIQATWTTESPVLANLCTVQEFEVLIKNTKVSTLTNLEYNFIFPPGLNIIPGSFEYAYPGGPTNFGTWTSIADPTANGLNTFGSIFSMDDNEMPYINSNGLAGIAVTEDSDSNRISIRFLAETVCDEYVSNTPLYFEATASDPCESMVSSGFTISEGVLINNAIPADNAQFLIVADPLKYTCGGPVPVNITGLNLSDTGGQTDMSVACFTFPDNLVYTSGSFVFTAPSGYTPTTVTETDLGSGITELCFDLPDEIGPQQFFAFTVELTPDSQSECREMNFMALVKSVIEDQVCEADGSLCTVFVNNTINQQIIIQIAPSVEISDIELVVQCDDNPLTTTYDYTMLFEGVSTIDYIGNALVEFYQDVDGDGVISEFDVVLASNVHTINVPSGMIVESDGTVTLQENISCPILVKATFDISCNCNSDEFYIDFAPTPDFVDQFGGPVILCPSDDLVLDVCIGYDFELSPSAGGSLTQVGNELTIALNDGYGINFPVVLNVTSQQAACPGEFELEISQLENFEIGPFTQQEVCDMECTMLDLELPQDWLNTVEILWTPDTYLDDPTSATPMICNPEATMSYTVTVTNPNSGCVAEAMYPVNVINTTIPTLEYVGFEECFLDYAPPSIIVDPAGMVDYKFYYENGETDLLIQSGSSNEFIVPFAVGDYYVIVSDGQCNVASIPMSIDLEECTFDLALQKTLSPTQVIPVYAGDTVTFEIEVFNQGTVAAQDIEVIDYIPAGFTLVDNSWFDLGNNEASIIITGPLLEGQSTTVSIKLLVTNAVAAGDAVNYAEISSGDDINNEGYPDIDSTPDEDNTNDGPVEDDVTDNTNGDEDDHDPASVPVEIFDLALTKVLATGQPVPVTVGDDVTYTITVCNQGTVDAFNVEIVDYIPTGMSLNDANWTSGANNTAYYTFAGPILPGTADCQTMDITVTVDSYPPSGSFQNFSEISDAEDADGDHPADIDSTPDDDDGNDGPFEDDVTDGTNGDEDDHDPADIPVVLPGECFASNDGPYCDGGQINLIENGTASVSWSWTGPNGFTSAVQNPTIAGVSILETGDYIVEITDINGLMSICTTSVEVTDPLAVVEMQQNVSCANLSDGFIDITVSGGQPPYTFDWDDDGVETPDDDTEDLINLPAGDYEVTITDAFGCTLIAPYTITQPLELACELNAINVSCNGASDGTISVVRSGGIAPFEYSLDGGAYQPGIMFVDVDAGTHVVTVRDGNGCTSVCQIEVTEPLALTCDATSTDETDCGANDGTITIVFNGGTGTVITSIDGVEFEDNKTFYDNLSAGIYTITVMDDNGCISTCEATVLAPNAPMCEVIFHEDVTCADGTNGSLTVEGSGGSGDYEYSIDGTTFQPSSTFNDLGAGNYTVTIRNIGDTDCASTCVVTITEPEPLVCFTEFENVTCEGFDDGEISVTATGGSLTYEYSIDGTNFQTTNSFTGLTSGAYIVTVRDAADVDCTTTCQLSISEPNPLTCSTDSIDVICFGELNGSIIVSVSGGTAPYEYNVNGDPWQAGSTLDNLPAGTHVVTVRDANGCQTTCPAIINQPDELMCSAATVDESDCAAEDGTITVTASGGIAPLMYMLNDGAPQASNVFGGLVGGAYAITIEDANGCTTLCDATITSPNAPACEVVFHSDVTCFGGSNGGLTVEGTGGSGSYEFSIDGGTNWQTSGVFDLLTAGDYTVIVRNEENNLCQNLCYVTIEEPEVLACQVEATNVNCNGVADGMLVVSATGGSDDLEYSIDGVSFQLANNFTGLLAGSYTVTVRDVNDQACTTTCTAIILEPVLLECEAFPTDVSCYDGADGTITVTTTGGTVPFQYSVDGGPLQLGNGFADLSAGVHTVTVIDANGCMTLCDATINQPSELACATIATDETDCEVDDGTITVEASGGAPPYEYSIDGLFYQPELLFENLSAGTYNITVRDANGCTSTCEATIETPNAPTCEVLFSEDVTCFGGSNGSLTVEGLGGTGDYEFSLDATTFQVSGFFTDLTAGNYTITVRNVDDPLCTTTCVVTIIEPPVLECQLDGTPVLCNGDADGTITASANGGSLDYEFSIDGINWQISPLFENLAANTYSVIVRDANDVNCTTSCDFSIAEPVLLECSTTTIPATCNGDSDGSIAVTAVGGVLPYEYTVDGSFWQLTTTIVNLQAGIYTVSVRDANGCISDCQTEILEPTLLTCTTTSTDETDCQIDDGTITITAEGGITPYQYSLNGNPYQSNNIYTGLGAGNYIITVQDANGCTTECDATIETPNAPICDITFTDDVTCFGGNNGSLTSVGSGGNGIYEFTIDEINWQTSGVFNDLVAGDYTVTIRNTGNPLCTSTCTVTIEEPAPLNCDLVGEDVTCNDESDGSIGAFASGGSGNFEYSLDGVIFQTLPTFLGLSAGTYEVTVRDAADVNCFTTCGMVISEPAELVCFPFANDASCNGGADGYIAMMVEGGITPYEYSIPDVGWQSSNQFNDLAAGSYVVTVRDANGCLTTCSIDINEPSLLACTATGTDASDCIVEDGTVTATPNGGTSPYEYSLNEAPFQTSGTPYQASGTFTGLVAGAYIVTVRDANGCTSECDVTITAPDAPVCEVTIVTNVTCNGGSDGVFTTIGTSGSGTYEYSIDGTNWQDSGVFEGLTVGNYTVTIRNFGNPLCTADCNVNIEEPLPMSCATVPNHVRCFGGNDGSVQILASGGSDDYEYSLDGTTFAPLEQITGLTAGSYTITVRDLFNPDCMTECLVEITEPEELVCTTEVTPVDCALGTDGTILVTVTGGTEPYTYSLDGGTIQPGNYFENLTAGIYIITIEDDLGCVTTCQDTIVLANCTFDLALTKSIAPSQTFPVYPGDDVTYAIEVCNQGSITGYNIEITDYLPVGFVLNDADWVSETGNSASYMIAGPLMSDDCITVEITTTITEDFDPNNTVNVAEITEAEDENGDNPPDTDSDEDNDDGDQSEDDEDNAEIPVDVFDLALIKQLAPGTPSTVTVGDVVTYVVTVSNQGTIDAYNIEIVDYLPAGMILSDANWSTGTANQVFTTISGPLLAGNTTTVNVSVTVDELPESGIFENFAEITQAEDVDGNNPPDIDSTPDSDEDNDGPSEDDVTDGTNGDEDDHDGAVIGVEVFDLAMTKILAPGQDPIFPGDEVIFTVTVENQGTIGGYNISVVDYLPDGITLSPNDTNGWVDNGDSTATVVLAGPLAPTDFVTVDILVLIGEVSGENTNFAEISGAEDENGDPQDDIDSTPDADDSNDGPVEDNVTDGTNGDEDDHDPADFTVETFDLALVKSISVDQVFPVYPGDDVTYVITVENQGTIDAYNVEITDYLPVGFVLNDNNWIAEAGNSASYTIAGPILSGNSIDVNITTTITEDFDPNNTVNVAEITEAEDENGDNPPDTDSDEDNDDGDQSEDDEDNAEIPVDVFDLALIKQLAPGTPSTVTVGDVVTYVVTVTNQGTIDAYNIEVVDYLPAGMSLSDANWSTGTANQVFTTISGPLLAGNTTTVNVSVTIDELPANGIFENFAEITQAEDVDGNNPPDIDSTPDSNEDNDGPSEDDVTDGTNGDEDDHDGAVIGVEVFDLALTKILAPDQDPIFPGDEVVFTVTVENQGTINGYNISVVDYLPDGITLSPNDTNGWVDNGDSTATVVLAGPLAPTDFVTVDILVLIGDISGDNTNFAEISGAEDENGDPQDDIDSTPDADDGNDGPVEDNVTDGTNGDEDDHDPADFTVETFDLALVKSISVDQVFPVYPGDDVTYVITVENQGTIDAYNVEITDYLPVGFVLNDNNWIAEAGNSASYTIAGPILSGNSIDVNITTTITEDFDPNNTVNVAEITEAEDENGDNPPDTDSDEDNDDGDQSEDDEDNAEIPVDVFDLALIKQLAPGTPSTVTVGDVVTYVVTVSNQGTIDAYNIEIVDYLPAGMSLADANWSTGTANQVFTTISGPLLAGNTTTVNVSVTVDELPANGIFENFAEITQSEDVDGNNPPDIDSTPDSDEDNDGPSEDDVTDGTNGDEDDHDGAVIGVEVFDFSLD